MLTCPARSDETGLSVFGTPGLIDMPSALSLPDGEIALSTGHFARTTHNTLSFQITPRLGGSFRYSIARDFNLRAGLPSDDYFDRSFDLFYRLGTETARRPALTLGIRDFGGTGVYASEYLVASKHLTPDLTFSLGMGWGRLGSYGGVPNPLGLIAPAFRTRPETGGTGTFSPDTLFRGDAAVFGGVEWAASRRLRLIAEYSSDAYAKETGGGLFDHRIPVNLGAKYRFENGVVLGGHLLYGSEPGITLGYTLNPKSPPFPGGIEDAPPGLTARPLNPGRSSAPMQAALAAQGLRLETLEVRGGQATARIGNGRFGNTAQAVGRAAQVMANHLPPEVETLTIRPAAGGIAASQVTLRRADLEAFEHDPDGSALSFAHARISDAAGDAGSTLPGAFPDFGYRLGAYASPSLFDPDSPLRLDAGIEVAGTLAVAPGWALSGAVRQRLAGNRAGAEAEPPSTLHHVRTDAVLYDRAGDLELSYLVAEHLFRPGQNLFGRVSAGYLERMFGGVSGELLWKPVDSRLGLGIEANYARQRAFELGFGFQDYDVVTGHASAYYELGGGYVAQIDVGRYLAGDWGATFGLDRVFANGVRVGAFFTLTEVPFDTFGEGAFDKGIRIALPLSWLSGQPSQSGFATAIRPVTRDGGARLDVPNRLYGLVRGSHSHALQRQWGKFWR